MAGWDRNANWNRDVLEHIAALLFALAGLADLATGLPGHRRRHVLGILSCGEAEARAFIIGISTGSPASEDAPKSGEEAARLASSLRALALALCVLLERTAPPALIGATGSHAARRKPAGRMRRQAAPPAPDTS